MNILPAALSLRQSPTMSTKPPTPREKEIQRLFTLGKSPEMIAIRLGMKLSKVLLVIAMMPKPTL